MVRPLEATWGVGVACLLLPGAECKREEVGVNMAVGSVGKRRGVEGEEENKDECDNKINKNYLL